MTSALWCTVCALAVTRHETKLQFHQFSLFVQQYLQCNSSFSFFVFLSFVSAYSRKLQSTPPWAGSLLCSCLSSDPLLGSVVGLEIERCCFPGSNHRTAASVREKPHQLAEKWGKYFSWEAISEHRYNYDKVDGPVLVACWYNYATSVTVPTSALKFLLQLSPLLFILCKYNS